MDFDVVVVGMGYTGLRMAVAAARKGLVVAGVDSSADRIEEIEAGVPGCGRTTVDEVELAALLAGPLRLRAGDIPRAPVYMLCVPSRDLVAAVDSVADLLRAGDLVVVQSTCPFGMVDDIVIPRLRSSGAIHVVHSPVRINPGHAPGVVVPRIVAGATPDALTEGLRFLSQLDEEVIPVRSIKVSELTKIFENTFRLVNISLVNELAAVCRESEVDVTDVLAAARSKPYGFLPHTPGAGAGGDCIPVCAEFFAAAANRHGVKARTVEAAVEVNDAMPKEILRRIPVRGRRVLVAGISYKPDVADVRRSAAVRIVEELRAETEVSYHDPYVPSLRLSDGTQLRSEAIRPAIADLVLLVTKHRGMDLAGFGAPIIDCSGGIPSIVEVQNV
ncbi:nucleotide sugar dehydrogenase [Kibdelosporangium philippinense]|uniref:Nucleotide sugar dehydrogenase n=1 Tax=Kibdelosporangium philippinense TaxID=211113 RepID=A0ABS8ZH61_9PSEU|nr:nucleotide sugar dehydrogenase [Kibdelosporangium philippinense]MCE7006235.1 nucleotide sugar dehydrogenase [Kibdelosporangium philippinense]